MSRHIIKIKDLYFEWSTIADSPMSFGMTEEVLIEYIKEEYGQRGLNLLKEKLERVDMNGHSAVFMPPNTCNSVEEFISGNRAGGDEEELTAEEIYNAYSYVEDEDEVTRTY
ncbi:MAG: hypothetical protein ACXAAT_18785 [Candidatus Hodarchaeales archaeon]|jgi:hypothetical protein